MIIQNENSRIVLTGLDFPDVTPEAPSQYLELPAHISQAIVAMARAGMTKLDLIRTLRAINKGLFTTQDVEADYSESWKWSLKTCKDIIESVMRHAKTVSAGNTVYVLRTDIGIGEVFLSYADAKAAIDRIFDQDQEYYSIYEREVK